MIGLVIREQPPLIPIWRRAVLLLPFVPFLWFFGHFFQFREVICTPPFDNPGWGLFEGGLFLLPLLGIYWFVSSFSLGVLSGVSIDQSVPREGPR